MIAPAFFMITRDINFMPEEFENLIDYRGQTIRLTNERWTHILDHPEMMGQRERISEALLMTDDVIATAKDETVHTYHKFYEQTPVTKKYLIVAVKIAADDAFVLTAFFSSRSKKGNVVWQK